MDQARAWKHDTDLGDRMTDPAFGPLGRDAVLTVIGLGYGVFAAGGLRGEEDEQA
jgi:hypothetical protein